MIHPTMQVLKSKYPDPDTPIISFDQEDEITLKANSYKPSIQPYKNKVLTRVNNTLTAELQIDDSFSRALRTVTYAVAQTLKAGYPAFHLAGDSTLYNAFNAYIKEKTGKAELHDYHSITALLKMLVAADYLVKFKGGNNESKLNPRSCVNTYAMTDKIRKLFDGVYLKDITTDKGEWFVLRQRDTKTDNNPKGAVLATNDDIKFSCNKVYKRAITNLNKLCREQRITMNGWQWQPVYQAVGISQTTDISCWDRDAGMRIYGGSFQCLPSGKLKRHADKGLGRQTLRINENACVESDFSAMHITIMYLKAGVYLNPELDPYHMPEFYSVCGDETQARGLVKFAVNTMFNASSRKSAECAIRGEYNRNRDQYDNLKNVSSKAIVDEILEMHAPIADSFCNDMGVKLQVIDGEIAIRVIDHFTKKGVICLPYHDSFVVDEQYTEELAEVMQKAWVKVLRCKSSKVATIKTQQLTNGTPVKHVLTPVETYYSFSAWDTAGQEAVEDLPPVEAYDHKWEFIPSCVDEDMLTEPDFKSDTNVTLENVLHELNFLPFEPTGAIKPLVASITTDRSLIIQTNKALLKTVEVCEDCRSILDPDGMCSNIDCLPF